MTMKWIVTLAAFAMLHVLGVAPLRAVRPDSHLTPGMAGAATTSDVCQPGFARRARNVSESEKRQVFAKYGVVPAPGERFEVDHLVPLELDGTNDIRNLWPQPFAGTWTAGQKDRLENTLHREVCRGQEPLGQAQNEIRQDWIGAYERRFGPGRGVADGG